MAVKAEFSADTSSFVKEVDKADVKLKAFSASAEKASGSSKQWSTAIGQADSLLSQAGINIGQTGKALDEITSAAGKTASELGVVATAGLVVGTAMAAWNIGKAIGEWTGLTKSIQDGTAALMGWGDVIAQTSSAQTDTINAAIRNGAAATISYSEAIKFNTEFHKKRLGVVKEVYDADVKSGEAWAELNSIGATYTETLATMNRADVAAIKVKLEQGASASTLAAAYGYTALQIKAVEASMKALLDADKAWLAGMKEANEQAEAFASMLTSVLVKAINDTADADERALAKLTAKTDAITASILAESAARESLAATTAAADPLTAAWHRMQTQLADLQKTKVGDIDTTARQQVIYNDYVKAVDAANGAIAQAPAALDATTAATDRASKATGVYMNQLHMLVDDPKLAGFFGFNAKGAVASTLYSGGMAGITPEMAAAMAAGQFIRTAGVGAVTVNVSQPLGTPQAVASAVSQALTPSIMQGRKMAGG